MPHKCPYLVPCRPTVSYSIQSGTRRTTGRFDGAPPRATVACKQVHCTAESQALDVCAVPTTHDGLAGVSAAADPPRAPPGLSSLERRHATVPRGTPPA